MKMILYQNLPNINRQSITTGKCFEVMPAVATLVLRKSTAGKYKLFSGVINMYSKPSGV